MSSEDTKTMANRRKFFQSFCTTTVTEYLLYNNTFSASEKQDIINIARKKANSKGYYRVTWLDFASAITEFRSMRK